MAEELQLTLRRRMRLAACAAAVGVVWLVVLPWAAQTAAVRERIARDEALGVDPSAKFYTELPAMPGIVARVEAIRRGANSARASTAIDSAAGSGTP